MTIAYAHPAGARYPKPGIPLFPVLSWGTFFPARERCPACVLDAGSILPVTTGRMALSLALEHMGIKQGEEVLIPGYHCNAMVEPVAHALARPVFYRLREDASVDLEHVKARLSARTRALMVTHYFGFPQDLTAIRAFCDMHGLVLIEDCAHVFFGEHAGKPLGSYGDYAFASPMKFFPTYDGGYLISGRHRVDRIPTRSRGWRFSLNAMSTILGRSVQYKRLRLLNPLMAGAIQLRNVIRHSQRRGAEVKERPRAPARPRYAFDGYFSGLPGEFDPEWIHTAMSSTSQSIFALAARSRIYSKRRSNYSALLDGLADLPGCRPLFPVLQPSVAPYVFPFLVDEARTVFPALKRLGIPISRFGEYLSQGFDRSICPVSVKFSRGVLQFPCHQEMTQEDVARLIATVRSVVLAEAR